ncbi:MAG: class I mannose-6-phosphate isomerase [Prevotellaceae bacterium]|jgi:mannose-6-phosphate isomerase|nr:class I mannose-6-phosphate isomerase [Prevotellaceae bacterium]
MYPLKFAPQFFEKIWGGQKIKKIFSQTEKFENIGEAWTLSAVLGNESVVENGFLAENNLAELCEVYLGDLLGEAVFEQYGSDFPLLVKIIEARENLSIQVHPNDELAAERHNAFGKNELWYMLDCEPDAYIIAGFNRKISEKEYLKAVKNNTIEDYLQKIPVKKGDAIFIPAGCIHAIGKGCMLLEIQQSSDITYRIYDYNRTDKNGEKRELHTELAVDAVDFDNWKHNLINKIDYNIIINEYFTINEIYLDKNYNLELENRNSFTLLCSVEGDFECRYNDKKIIVKKYETILIPAEIHSINLLSNAPSKILDVFVS